VDPADAEEDEASQQLVGSEEWSEQRPDKRVAWERVEEVVAKYSRDDGSSSA